MISSMLLRSKNSLVLKGFSLPEVLLSVFILSVGMVTIVAVMAGSLRSSYETRDQVIATGLAVEGVELIRNVRDNDFVTTGDSFSLLTASTGRRCRMDWDDPVNALDCINSGSSSTFPRYYLQYVNGHYVHNGGSRERYARFIDVDYPVSGRHATVRSYVYWEWPVGDAPPNSPTACDASSRCVYAEVYLTDWLE